MPDDALSYPYFGGRESKILIFQQKQFPVSEKHRQNRIRKWRVAT